MKKEEQDRLEHRLAIHRDFLRHMYAISDSHYKLRHSIAKASIGQLKVLLGILRATSIGAIPIKQHRHDKVIRNRHFKQVIVAELKNDPYYRKVLHLDRSELVEFITKLVSVWKHLLAPLFMPSENE